MAVTIVNTIKSGFTLIVILQIIGKVLGTDKINRKHSIEHTKSRMRRELDSWTDENGDRITISNRVIVNKLLESNTSQIFHRREKRTVTTALTSAEQTTVVTTHNDFRKNEGAADMKYMVWNNDLASLAQEWADACDFVHGQSSGRVYTDYSSTSSMGQNLFAGTSSSVDLTGAITAWFNEKNDYTFDTRACSSVCGHYTQVVWANSVDIGCGMATCSPLYDTSVSANYELYSSGSILVCNYGPAGNLASTSPYTRGDACTKCNSGHFYCNDNLCDTCTEGENGCTCEASNACKNCANIASNCSCDCHPGYTGVGCSDVCEDTHANCRNGWFIVNCGVSSVQNGCPLMCSLCTAASSSDVCESTTAVTTAIQFSTAASSNAVSESTSQGSTNQGSSQTALTVTPAIQFSTATSSNAVSESTSQGSTNQAAASNNAVSESTNQDSGQTAPQVPTAFTMAILIILAMN